MKKVSPLRVLLIGETFFMTVLLTYRYRYEGPTENGWPQGKGKYTFPNGTVYEGYFDKGEFHGDGVLVYPKKVPKNIASSYNIIF